MLSIVRATILFLAISCLFPLPAVGQSDFVLKPEPLPEPPAEVGNWYLRGDIAYQINRDPTITYNEAVAPLNFGYAELDHSGRIGIGGGRRIGEILRADVTADFSFPTDFTGGTVAPCSPATCATLETADMWSLAVLANAYLDLGHYSGFSPYIGAGLGFSYMHWDYSGGLGSYSDDDVRFTWALMAGLSYDINANWTVDAGYRFLHTPEGEIVGNNAALSGPIRFDDLKAHTLRFGVRFTPGGPEG